MKDRLASKIEHLPLDIDECNDPGCFHEHYWKICSLRLLKKYSGPGEGFSLLDYGCGRGEFLKLAQEAGFVVSGMDVDERCVRLSSRFAPATLVDGGDHLASAKPKSVDIVTSIHVLEHAECPKKLLSNMARVARRFVLIAVPNLRCWKGIRSHGFEWVNEGHLQGWDRETLFNLATRHCGLRFMEFASDMVSIPSLNWRVRKYLGEKFDLALRLKVLSRLSPGRSMSIIGLFSPIESDESGS